MEDRTTPNSWEVALAAAQVGTGTIDVRAAVHRPSGQRGWVATVVVDHYGLHSVSGSRRTQDDAAIAALRMVRRFADHAPPAHMRVWLDNACSRMRRRLLTSRRHLVKRRVLDMLDGPLFSFHPANEQRACVHDVPTQPEVGAPLHRQIREVSHQTGRTVVVCDGSYRRRRGVAAVGIAWSDDDHTHAEGHPSPRASSRTAEHLAVLSAARDAAPGRPLTLVSDDMSLVKDLGPSFTAAGRSVRLVWAPGHCDPDHNEVDHLAGRAAKAATGAACRLPAAA